MSTESKIRTEILESLNQTLESDLPKLFDLIKLEAEEMQECDNITLKKSSDEVKRMDD